MLFQLTSGQQDAGFSQWTEEVGRKELCETSWPLEVEVGVRVVRTAETPRSLNVGSVRKPITDGLVSHANFIQQCQVT